MFAVGVFVLMMYVPVIYHDFDLWKLNFLIRAFKNDSRDGSRLYPVIHFFIFSSPLLVYILLIINSANGKKYKEFFIWIIVIGSLTIFARGYYYQYLFHFALWRATMVKEFDLKFIHKLLFTIAVFFGFLFNIGISGFQVVENRQYFTKFKKDLAYLRAYVQTNPTQIVWVSPHCSMSVIDYPNARMHMDIYKKLSGVTPVLDSSQIYFIENKSMLEYIKGYTINKDDTLVLQEIYKPIKGLHRLTLHNSRSDSLGLWKLSIVNKQNFYK